MSALRRGPGGPALVALEALAWPCSAVLARSRRRCAPPPRRSGAPSPVGRRAGCRRRRSRRRPAWRSGRRSTATTGMPVSSSTSSRESRADATAITTPAICSATAMSRYAASLSRSSSELHSTRRWPSSRATSSMPAHHRGEERVLDVGDDRRPHPGPLLAQRPGRRGGGVAQLLGGGSHPGPAPRTRSRCR